MNTEILIVEAEEFGIEQSQASELLSNLPQIQAEREAMIVEYNEVLAMDKTELSTSKRAREVRLKISKNRTQGINVWHKTSKDFFLKGGQFVDAIKRKEVAINERMESELEEIENYAIIQENLRLDSLEKTRFEKLEPFKEFVPFGANIRNISDEDFEKLYNGAKLQFEAKVAADKSAEEERLEAERVERERIENERKIKALHEERKQSALPYFQFWSDFEKTLNFGEVSETDFNNFMTRIKGEKAEHDKQIEAQRIENERLKKEAEEKEKALELEQKKAREEAEKIEAQRQAELKAEREKQARLEAELEAKRQSEIKQKQEREAAELKAKKEAEKLAKAPIKKQLTVWVESFEIQGAPVENEQARNIQARFDQFKKWAVDIVEQI